MKRAYFIRKPLDIQEVKDCTKTAIANRARRETYKIRKTISLSDEEYKNFIGHLSDDYDFLMEYTDLCGPDVDGYTNCLAVRNKQTKEKILVNTEGYNYARYVALLPESDLNG